MAYVTADQEHCLEAAMKGKYAQAELAYQVAEAIEAEADDLSNQLRRHTCGIQGVMCR
jgi:hypothetical protein